ncbi:acetolactate synthase [Cryphonectria parasitica EP155]|uniref:Acetolactate synthase n=1 Tax=Cryphonectria parasitica (strain ATCC 38755 / EP155) TaxID=660469 RepID=A0A9P4XTJ1_CRYP1|nr:acetolactate synthase [Cryphonectria parasitica EP155]KAF3761064.1 acetolactate synthase [Cryphonectria parasitica EP155]
MSSEVETVDIVIDSLRAAGVKYVFGVPGAKIDSVFNALVDHPEIKLIVCRHEQNAAFIAGAIGKITGRPGVCIATSGPGTSNLVTGLVTANDEGAPVVAIVGSVQRSQAAKRTHQSLQAVALLRPVTKKVTAAVVEDQVSEIMLDAFRVAAAIPQGATVVSLPIDIMTAGHKSSMPAAPAHAFIPPAYGPSSEAALAEAAKLISQAKFPVLFLGMRGADQNVVDAVHGFLRKYPIPVVETFQAAGAISQELVHLFYGRIGLFRNQPGDQMIRHSDLVITVGYDQAEYDANQWNIEGHSLPIIHMDTNQAAMSVSYSPKLELIGSMADNLAALTDRVTTVTRPQDTQVGQSIYKTFHEWETGAKAQGTVNPKGPVHPLHFIRLLQGMITTSTTVTSDVGSLYIWLSRFFYSYAPKTFLVSNAQQTLGVALPWAIGASLVHGPEQKVVSVSGDGGFLFSGQELVTAVQQGCNITHFIWNDGKYNMVEFQEVDKYGRSAGVDLGGVDFVKYAEAFGAKGLRATSSEEIESVMKEALAYKGVCVVDIVIDYSDNHELMANVIAGSIS